MKKFIFNKIKYVGLVAVIASVNNIGNANELLLANSQFNQEGTLVVTPTIFEQSEIAHMQALEQFSQENKDYLKNFELQYAELEDSFSTTLILAKPLNKPVVTLSGELRVSAIN